MTVPELLAVATAAGLTVQVVNGQLFVKGPKRAAGVGRAVLDRKAEVFRHLTATPPAWDAAAAIARMHAADAVVEECGWPGGAGAAAGVEAGRPGCGLSRRGGRAGTAWRPGERP